MEPLLTSRQEISGPVPVWQRGEGEVLLLKSREAHGVGFWISRTEQVLLMKTALHSSAHRDNFPGKILLEEIILVSHLEKYLIEYFFAAAQNTHDKMKENTKGTKQQLM